MQAWLALPEEPADKFRYFKLYRDRPAELRDRHETTDEIAELAGVNERRVRDWKVRWRWKERALAFDVAQDKKSIQQLDELQRQYRVQQGIRLQKLGSVLDDMLDQATTMTVERVYEKEDEDNPGQYITFVDRALNTQEAQQLVRAFDTHDKIMRRFALLPVNTTTKHLDEPYLNLGKRARKVTYREAVIEDADGFDHANYDSTLREVPPKVIESGA